ncbi:2,3-dehydroadipyl-CoA hydratase [Cupriavidus yeoncheonensis]|uniref:2,3-dehydroadipyl-CoA hydratase n=1 Tax=Cupriavidus yeoncheonensis TaxID=1462994 RepID=A0A916IZ21_9BURK|nr:enoyl-CoA hydratase/isomerase family protein [Cupriavidus yeoncheonensis]CAG2155150.1 2,3-dehydroadipyl-CoA hydratase [Cupriavidus yeoncheonensis]
MSTEKFVSFSRKDAIGYVTLHRPPDNRANRKLVADLGDAVREAALSDVRVLVVNAEGENFCMGGDFREWSTYNSYQKRKERWQFSNGILSALENLTIPTIASVHGRANGFGFELALHTDFVIASEEANFRFTEATIAVFPLAGGVQRIAERAGRNVANRIVMLAENLSASQAHSLNIVSKVVPHELIGDETLAMATQLAEGPTRAHAATKAVLGAWASGGIHHADAQMIELIPAVLDSEDVRAGIDSAAKALATGGARPALKFTGK